MLFISSKIKCLVQHWIILTVYSYYPDRRYNCTYVIIVVIVVCANTWTVDYNTSYQYGQQVQIAPATTAACQLSCINTLACLGIDFNLGTSSCYHIFNLNVNKHLGTSSGVMHYNLTRCQSAPGNAIHSMIIVADLRQPLVACDTHLKLQCLVLKSVCTALFLHMLSNTISKCAYYYFLT